MTLKFNNSVQLHQIHIHINLRGIQYSTYKYYYAGLTTSRKKRKGKKTLFGRNKETEYIKKV